MIRALVIGAEERDRIRVLRERAAAEPFSLAEVERFAKGFDRKDHRTRPAAPMIPDDFTIAIPHGFTATYTMEQHPAGLCRHLSISVDKPGAGPNPYAVFDLLGEFGFAVAKDVPINEGVTALLTAQAEGRLALHMEEFAPGCIAVNIVEPIR